ncbi:autotransporter assembly complex protein TamA [Variovorax saccharolyticus]|uniref:autotransporter assembly complex protein TamA n=1 Tax=Variovorax saccharolyticus TaxID=3053516 RepID=UPI0025774D96|nr:MULTISPECIES: BamA/TamA family outer membrane protein [unclassified Variovorax]MDM0020567.1 BamA/TamA family outer membrane protein [Variovorax sp. J22R187]MDM0025876.1 BamA/TamA family outer membrane protein [Variovorax sp. J31P216]
MLWVVRSHAPAWLPAFLFAAVLFLSGCSLLPKTDAAESDATPSAVASEGRAAGAAFTVDVRAPDSVREHLERHLEIQRFRELDDLGAVEISRLMVAAEANARELLNILGYFTPTLTLELVDTPGGKAPREVRITVDPGPITHVSNVQVDFSGPIAEDPASESQRDGIRTGWTLRAGQPFSQQAWDNAKTTALRSLTARRYPTGSILTSLAEIDADRSEAKLSATYGSGPAYRFGPLVVNGSQRYPADNVRRLARVPTGSDYDQQQLLDAQQRLASSGYFDSVFLTLDTSGADPLAAPVIAQVREAPLQRVVLGVGFTTDSGARLSIDHSHNDMPLLGWRAVSKLTLDRDTQSLGTDWSAIPDDSGWRTFTSALLKSEVSGSYTVDSGRLRGGRNKADGHIDRSYFLQYDYARNVGFNPPPSASALTLNWGWIGRYFDNAAAPTRGQGLGLELAAGYTLTGEQLPFTRTVVRWVGFVPAGTVSNADRTQSRNARIQLRAEAGAVSAADRAQIPSTLNFLTGGDTTVRGYGYRTIGAVKPDGQVIAGRYLGVASVEWQRPFVYDGQLTAWESAVFVDVGAVADRPGDMEPKVGVGFGGRWASPIGPVQIDLAYGVQVHKFRLHVRLGFTF